MADEYQPQLNPASGNETSFAGAPGDWGAGISQGLESAGNSIDSAIHQVKEKQRDAEATQAGVQFAQDATGLDNAAVEARQHAGPGGDGHSQNVDQMIDGTTESSLGNIRDRHVREVFQQRYADLKQQLGTREYGWQAGQYVTKLATDFDQTGSVFARQAASTGDPHTLLTAMPAIEATGRSLALDSDTQDKLIREQQNKVALSWAGAAVRLNPSMLIGDGTDKGVLDDPSFTKYLSNPEAIDELRHQAEVQLRQNAAIKDRDAAAQKAAVIARNGLFTAQLQQGHVPTPAEWEQHITENKGVGLDADALDYEGKKDVADINQAYQGMPPSKWRSDIQALQQKVTAAGANATDYDRMHLQHLIQQSGGAIARFNDDPQGFAAGTPNPAPGIDWNSADPAALQKMGSARTAWANTFAPSNGVVNPASVLLNVDEKKQFSDGLKGGNASQIETLQRLQTAFGPAQTANVAEYLMPGDKNVKLLASLNGRGMELYKRGVDALDSKLLTLGAEGNSEVAQADKAAIGDSVRYWQQAIPPDLQAAFMQVAPKLAAGVAHESGNRSPTGDELKSLMASAVQRVGGLRGTAAENNYTGGFVGWKTGPVWLPSDMGREEFSHRMTVAGADDWVKAGGGHPYYVGPNGKLTPLTPSQMTQLGEYRLVPTGAATGIYALERGGRLKTKDGHDWTFNIRSLR